MAAPYPGASVDSKPPMTTMQPQPPSVAPPSYTPFGQPVMSSAPPVVPPGYTSPGQPVISGAPMVVVTGTPFLGTTPTTVQCPQCQTQVVTQVRYESGLLPWLICLICFLFGCFFIIPFFLCWIPFIIDDCKDVYHYCPNCHRMLGARKKL